MKKIAITQRLIKNDSYHEIREALDVNYSKLIRACGYLPIVLPYKIDFKDYMKELDITGIDNRDISTTRLNLNDGSYIEVNPVELMGDAVDNTDDPEIIKQFKDFVLNNLY